MSIEEKRVHQRHRIKVSVSLTNNNRLVRSSDLSLGGIFVETYAPPNVGDSIVFILGAAFKGAIRLETSSPIQAIVKWLRTDEKGEYCGFGASFVDLTESQKGFVEKVIEKSETESLMDFAELESEDLPGGCS
jgi:hypothetical protein